MAVRPRLKTHARALRRGPGAVQFGLVPEIGFVLEGLCPAEVTLLQGLDGSRDSPQLYAAATGAGIARNRLDQILAELRSRHLLVDDPTDRAHRTSLLDASRPTLDPDADALAVAYQMAGDGYDPLAARRTQHVVIDGAGGLPEALAQLLRAGGIGRVDIGAHAADLLDLDLRERAARRHYPGLVVLAASGALAPSTGAPWWRRRVPHLPLVAQGHRVTVGPLVAAGRGPCLGCLDLHRSDRDRAWPALLSQLAPPSPGVGTRTVSAESTLTAVAAGAAAMITHTVLDGQDVPVGVSLEVSLPWPSLTHRRWSPHPRCGCAAPDGWAAEEGRIQGAGGREGTMDP